jgi:excisionase family DNA binding protein
MMTRRWKSTGSEDKAAASQPQNENGTSPPLEPLAMRAKDAARLLGISTRTLWSMTAGGEIPHVRVRRIVTYPVDALRDWLRRRAKGGK